MKQILRKTLLVLLGGIFMSTATWGDTTIGNVNEGWYPNHYITFTLGKDKTLTLNFTVTGTKNTENYQGWITKVRKGDDQIFFMQPSCGYWGTGGVWDAGAKCNVNNYDWTDTNFRTNLQGASVKYSLRRIGSEIILTEDVTTTASKKFRHYFVFPYDSEDELLVDFGADAAALTIADIDQTNVITNSEAYPTITGTLIGDEDNTTGFWTVWSDYFTIAPNSTFTLRYKVYTNGVQNHYGALPYVTTDADRGATGYTEYFGLRPDNWVNVADVHATSHNYNEAFSWNWATFREKVDGSTVTVTITRTDDNVAIREEFAPADASTTLWEEYSKDCGDGTQNIRVFLAVEGAHIDLLPVSGTIAASGYSTLASAYGLDFANATGLEAAYVVTSTTTSAVNLTSVDELPANSGVILKGTPGDTYSIPIKSTAAYAGTNKLHAAVTAYNCAANEVYIMQGGQFHLVTEASTVPAGKAYLLASDVPSGARSLEFFFDDETTGVTSIEKGQLTIDNAWYNLNGQKVLNPSKGLYIVNGKKVVIK